MAIKRNTIQRVVVLETVNRLQNHATADEIYSEIAITHPSISRGTVYRNLNQLSERGDIKKVEVANGSDCFDHRSFKHYHIKCSICAKVFDVEMEYKKDLENDIKNLHDFEFSGHDIMFSGICSKCKKKAYAGA